MEKSSPAQFVTGNFMLDLAKGIISGHTFMNKFGRSTNLDNGIDTDIHDGANAVDDLDIWVAPTQARIHQIVSTNAGDDGNPAGIGARTVRIYGLTSWDTKEVSEDIVLNGVTNVATANSYVIIYRMKVLTKGATNSNVGVITATAAVDTTVTAQINAGEGQTQMAIYGIPSTQTAYITQYYADEVAVAGGAEVVVKLLVNLEPNSELTNFLTKHTRGIRGGGTSGFAHSFKPYKKIEGPAIIKVQGNGDANNMDISAGFDVILVDNN